MISRLNSIADPIELKVGMVFALETYCPATDGISAARIEEEIVVTDTLPVVLNVTDTKIKVLSVAGILADTIKRVFEGESVSELFAGENALF